MKQAKLLVSVLLLSVLLAGVTFSAAKSDSDIYKIEYHFSVEPPFEEILVTMTVSNYPAQSLSLWIDKAHPDPIDIAGFSAVSVDGEEINATDITCNSWECQVARIDNGSHRNFVVSYTVRPGISQDNPSDIYQAGIIDSQYCAFSGYMSIPLPNRYEPDQILITYSIPEDQGWKFYSIWQETEFGLDPSDDEIDTYANIQNSVFAAGIFYEFNENVNGNATTIIIPKNYPQSQAEDVASGLFKIYNYQSTMFGTSAGSRFLTIVTNREDRPYGRRIFPGEWSTSMSFESSPYEHNFYSPTHRSYHRWNSWFWGTEDEQPNWWGEGTATYYSTKIPAKLGLNTGEDYQNDLIRTYQSLLNENSDAPLSESRDSRIVYRKGGLVVSLIDYEIKNRTNGLMSLDDFERLIFEKYSAYHNNGSKKRCNNYCLLQELNNLTETDFTEFFKKYVFGQDQLPVDWLKSDDDNDSLLNYQEILYDTNLFNVDTDSDSYQDNVEIRFGTNPLSADNYPTPTPVPTSTSTNTPEPTTTKTLPTLTPESQTGVQGSPSLLSEKSTGIALSVMVVAIVIYWISNKMKKRSK